MDHSRYEKEERGIAKNNITKIIKVKSCDECEYNHHIYSGRGAEIAFQICLKGLKYGEIKDYPIIPKWCPLEDYKK